jgi:hypothetical protein
LINAKLYVNALFAKPMSYWILSFTLEGVKITAESLGFAATIIMVREETASTRRLLNSTKFIKDNSILWKWKEMDFMEKIGEISITRNGASTEHLK